MNTVDAARVAFTRRGIGRVYCRQWRIQSVSSATNADPELSVVAYSRKAPKELFAEPSQLGVMFLPGLHSSMGGRKALALQDHALNRGHAFVRFDYPGHGDSSGEFGQTCVADWYAAAAQVFEQVAQPLAPRYAPPYRAP